MQLGGTDQRQAFVESISTTTMLQPTVHTKQQCFWWNSTNLLHPAYSPDLAPCDLFLFRKRRIKFADADLSHLKLQWLQMKNSIATCLTMSGEQHIQNCLRRWNVAYMPWRKLWEDVKLRFHFCSFIASFLRTFRITLCIPHHINSNILSRKIYSKFQIIEVSYWCSMHLILHEFPYKKNSKGVRSGDLHDLVSFSDPLSIHCLRKMLFRNLHISNVKWGHYFLIVKNKITPLRVVFPTNSALCMLHRVYFC